MRSVTTRHAFNQVHRSDGDTSLAEFIAQELAVHFHDIAFPVMGRRRVMMTTISIKMNTHREVKLEKSSTTTFVEETFDRMSSNARSRSGLISS